MMDAGRVFERRAHDGLAVVHPGRKAHVARHGAAAVLWGYVEVGGRAEDYISDTDTVVWGKAGHHATATAMAGVSM